MKVNLCVQLGRGLQALHIKNIMHRDIKPGNILVEANWNLKICDFGFGKKDSHIGRSEKIGTPMYRDPNV